MKLVIASDHAGFALKEEMRANSDGGRAMKLSTWEHANASPRTTIRTLPRKWAKRSRRALRRAEF